MKMIGQIFGVALFICTLLVFPGSLALAETPAMAADVAGKSLADVGSLENITLDRVKGKERVTFTATKISAYKVEEEPGNSVVLKLENLHVPEILLRPIYEESMKNIRQVIAEQKTINSVPWVYVTVDLDKPVPYSLRQEGQNVVLDFNVASLGEADLASMGNKRGTPEKGAPLALKNSQKTEGPAERKTGKTSANVDFAPVTKSAQKISLDFQDADMRAVLRLLAETGGVSIVAGPDVKGAVNIHMRDVPWDQALETILDIHGLAKKEMGSVISVMTLEKKRKDEEVRKAAEKDQLEAEVVRKAREQQLLVEKGKLRQISIEAKIVEASDGFVRDLGVAWAELSRRIIIRWPGAPTRDQGRDRQIQSLIHIPMESATRGRRQPLTCRGLLSEHLLWDLLSVMQISSWKRNSPPWKPQVRVKSSLLPR